MSKKIIVSGVGCCLVDRLYNNVSFNAHDFLPHISKKKGDGGLTPGQLVFKEEFENFEGENFETVLKGILTERRYDKINIGGPSIVSMIHAAQLSDKDKSEFHIYGYRGDDNDGEFIKSLLEKTPLQFDNYKAYKSETPSTIVLSDPLYDNGSGERIFINSIGAAWKYSPNELKDDFFASDVVVFGGTALAPLIHDNLTELLAKAKLNNCITIVNTVYDFRNEKTNPDLKWPLGESDDSYGNIDLLMMDMEEALRLSGKTDINEAMVFFREKGTGAVIVTSGTDNIRVYSNGKLFGAIEKLEMPISNKVYNELKQGKGISGDTTGCGDNFVGGVIASLVSQMQNSTSAFDLTEACSWGVVSGGTTTFYMGGMYEEKKIGDKKAMIEPYYELYKNQMKS